MMNNKGLLVILSAPSGCGKDTVFQELKKKRDDVVESVSATTRKPRDGEIDGVNYYFKSDSDFQMMIVAITVHLCRALKNQLKRVRFAF